MMIMFSLAAAIFQILFGLAVWVYMPSLLFFFVAYRLAGSKCYGKAVQSVICGLLVFSVIFFRMEIYKCIAG